MNFMTFRAALGAFLVSTMGMTVGVARAEPLSIVGFETSSGLSFEGATAGNYFTLEFAPTLTGPWTNWGSVSSQPITGTVMASPSPFFYRIRQTDSSAFPAYAPAVPEGMVYVPGGTFLMGFSGIGASEDTVAHPVTLSGFYLGKFEVTYALWYGVRQWALTHGYSFNNAGREGGLPATIGAAPTSMNGKPVTTLSWHDAIVWCNARSEREGLAPVYTSGGEVLRDSTATNAAACDLAVFNTGHTGYRLPTEAEWEFAARFLDGWGWTPGDWLSGASDSSTNYDASGVVAWYAGNSDGEVHIVGTRQENQLEIFDMSGNVTEWCWDWYADYDSGAVTNPIGPPGPLTERVFRGGNLAEWPYSMENADRDRVSPDGAGWGLGFRCAKGL